MGVYKTIGPLVIIIIIISSCSLCIMTICNKFRLAVIFQNPARNHFWEAGIVMQSYVMLDTVQ